MHDARETAIQHVLLPGARLDTTNHVDAAAWARPAGGALEVGCAQGSLLVARVMCLVRQRLNQGTVRQRAMGIDAWEREMQQQTALV